MNGFASIGAMHFGNSGTALRNLVPSPPASMIASLMMDDLGFMIYDLGFYEIPACSWCRVLTTPVHKKPTMSVFSNVPSSVEEGNFLVPLFLFFFLSVSVSVSVLLSPVLGTVSV